VVADDLVLEVNDLKTHFFPRSGVVKAVDGVSFYLRRGETLGIVGESGSGKSMTALSLMRLVPEPGGRIVGGQIIFDGEDLLLKDRDEMVDIRGREICMILQDPMTSLNPVFSVGDQLIETFRRDADESGLSLWERGVELLRKVRIPAAETRMRAYPHEMSGGMRQRVVGAVAISRSPKILIADEPTTSLDATIQMQYLRLLKDIQTETGAAIIFITHDFGIVARMCDRVAVMYAGKMVESAPVEELFARPSHPYTQALLESVPDLEEEVDWLASIEGQPPSLDALPPGCSFEPRCPYAFDRCRTEYPDQFTVGSEHLSQCWRLDGSAN
jgi:oligopeptide/dipeptide ABC transporter ATP-binding protein